MRLLLDLLVVLMLVGILGGVVVHTRHSRGIQSQREFARSELRRLQQQVNLHGALARVEGRDRNYPASIEPEWFNGDLPQNPLLKPGHPWVEVANRSQQRLRHPVVRVASDRNVASFWYNPYTGIARARVPAGVSDAQALELYNFINDCELENLFAN